MKKCITIVVLNIFIFGCTSKLIIQSEPSQAEVSVRVEGRKDKIVLGQTPMEITEKQLSEKLSITPDRVQWLNLILQKKEFSDREVLIPSNRWGESVKIVKLNLFPNIDNSKIVQEMLSYFFNAKKFAETRQYPLAHEEIDKILDLDKKNVRALNMKAGVYFLEGNLDESKKYYRQALAIDPASSDAIKMLEKIELKQGVRQ